MFFRQLFAKIFTPIFLVILLLVSQSCTEQGNVGCVEAEEFSQKNNRIESNPKNYKNPLNVYGNYSDDSSVPGQSTDWVDTGLVSNGDPVIIKITGAWTTAMGEGITDDELNAMPFCPLCTKKIGFDTDNCFCQDSIEDDLLNNETDYQFTQFFKPQAAFDEVQNQWSSIDCGSSEHNDPEKCSCKPLESGMKLDDSNLYHYSLFHFKRTSGSGERLVNLDPSQGQRPCLFRGGMGAFIGLWGSSGSSTPGKVYHLYTTEKNCPISTKPAKDKDGKAIKDINGNQIESCKDDSGRSRWEYIFRSKDNRIFKKSDTEYHSAGEVVKVLLYDNFYFDNYGRYTMVFLSGVDIRNDSGILEKIVSNVENLVMGDINPETNKRENGIIEFIYKSLTKDNYFNKAVQISLVCYVMFFGIGYLLGVVELSKKEVLMRLIKIGFVIMFTSYNGWEMYKGFIVDLFKNGMDSLVSYVCGLFDAFIAKDSSSGSMVNYIHAKKSAGLGNSGRFTFADAMIQDLTSSAAAKKIWGLFFVKGGSAFGLFYIIIIYSLIFYLIYVLVCAALVYLVTLIKLVFALGLGPVFFCFSLFGKTQQMFKNWLGFMGARSLEMLILFVVLMPFLSEINFTFKEMLFYRACMIDWDIGPGTSTVIVSEVDRGLFSWTYYFIKIASLIFITNSAINRSTELSGQLINIGGVPNRDPKSEDAYGSSGFAMITGRSTGIMARTYNAAIKALKSKYIGGNIAKGMRSGFKLATKLARNSGANDYINKQLSKVPIIRELAKYPGPRSMMRNSIIDGAINSAIAQANAADLKGKDWDNAVRSAAIKELDKKMAENKNKFVLLGIDSKNIEKRFDEKLVKNRLKDELKKAAKELKEKNNLIGKELRQEIRERGLKWAEENLVGDGRKVAEKYLAKGGQDSLRDHVRKYAKYDAKEFATKFKDNEEMQVKFLAEAELDKSRLERKRFGEGQSRAFQKLERVERGFGFVRDKIVGLKGNKQNPHLYPDQQIKDFNREILGNKENQPTENFLKIKELEVKGLEEALKRVDGKIEKMGEKTLKDRSLAEVEKLARLKFDKQNLESKLEKAKDEQRVQAEKIASFHANAISRLDPANPNNQQQITFHQQGLDRAEGLINSLGIQVSGANFGNSAGGDFFVAPISESQQSASGSTESGSLSSSDSIKEGNMSANTSTIIENNKLEKYQKESGNKPASLNIKSLTDSFSILTGSSPDDEGKTKEEKIKEEGERAKEIQEKVEAKMEKIEEFKKSKETDSSTEKSSSSGKSYASSLKQTSEVVDYYDIKPSKQKPDPTTEPQEQKYDTPDVLGKNAMRLAQKNNQAESSKSENQTDSYDFDITSSQINAYENQGQPQETESNQAKQNPNEQKKEEALEILTQEVVGRDSEEEEELKKKKLQEDEKTTT